MNNSCKHATWFACHIIGHMMWHMAMMWPYIWNCLKGEMLHEYYGFFTWFTKWCCRLCIINIWRRLTIQRYVSFLPN